MDLQKTQAFWDYEISAHSHVSWMESARVREYINTLIGGKEHPMWPIDWFERETHGRKFRRALSIGCGTGPLERDLIRRGLCDRIDAFDGSVGSLHEARRQAAEMGMADRIRYFAADFNDPQLPSDTYDLVCIHQALHHVGKLEKFFRAVMRTLSNDGLFYIDEYVGPSRTSWNDDLIEPHRQIYRRLPNEAQIFEELPLPIQVDDPSEALRSDEILSQMARGFRITSRRDYGGTLLAPLYPAINWNRAPVELLTELIENEKKMLQSGTPSYHVIAIAQRRRGPMRLVGSARYFLEPKIRRIRYEVLRRVSAQSRF